MNPAISAELKPGKELRSEFPIFANLGTQRPLAFLDTAASSQKPRCVIERIKTYFEQEHANIHRGAYRLSSGATQFYEACRDRLAKFINAPARRSVIFTKGTTEAVNLVAHSTENWFRPGDVILLTVLEHHSNLVPWQMLASRKKLKLEYVDITETGNLNLNDLTEKVKRFKPRLCSFTHTSNVLGCRTPVKEITRILKEHECYSFLDAAQAASCCQLDVQDLDIDFLAFSGHKIYGPTGVGVLFARSDLVDKMQPFMGGGDMIETVALEGSTWAPAPQKFEAGTPAIADVIALKTAIEFIAAIGTEAIESHSQTLRAYALHALDTLGGITIHGRETSALQNRAGIISFNLDGVHPHDIATVADTFNVQIRAGHHCAMPLLKRLNIAASARISFGVYSCQEDIDQLIEALTYARKLFHKNNK